MRKKIYHLVHLLEENNLKVPDNVKKTTSIKQYEKPPDEKVKGKIHALIFVSYSSSSTWVLGLGTLYHMTSSKCVFTYMDP